MFFLSSAVIQHNVEIIAGVANVKATSDPCSYTLDSQSDGTWIRLGTYIGWNDHIPPAFIAICLHTLQGAVNLRSNTPGNHSHMPDTFLPQAHKKIWRKEHLFVTNKAWKIRQVARRVTKPAPVFGCPPIILMIDIPDNIIRQLRGCRRNFSHPFNTAMTFQVGSTGERGPFFAAAFSKGSASPFTQAGCAKRRQQVAHIPIIVVAACLLEGEYVVMCKEGLALVMSPIQSVYCARNVFRCGNICSVKRIYGSDEYAVNIEEDCIKRSGKFQTRSLPE